MITGQNATKYGWADARIALRSNWLAAVLIASFIFLTGGWLTLRKPAIFESTVEVFVDPEPVDSPVIRLSTEVRPSSTNPIRKVENRLESGALLLKVSEACNLSSRWNIRNKGDIVRLLRNQITYYTDEANRIIEIRVRDTSPSHSSSLANSVAQTLREFSRADSRKSHDEVVQNLDAELRYRKGEIEQIEKRLFELNRSGENRISSAAGEVSDLRNRLVENTHLVRSLEAKHQLAVTAVQNIPTGLSILDHPLEEDAVRLNSRTWRMFCYTIFGLLIGAAAVCLLSVGRSPAEIVSSLSKELNLLLMSYVPVGYGLHFVSDEHTEAFRDLRNRIHRLPARESAAILILPRGENSGVTEVVANLARTIAAAGETVLAIDANFRAPGLHELFQAAQHPGIADFLSGEMRMEETVVRTRHKNLWLMPAGPLPSDPGGLVSGKRMNDLIWEMKSRFDYILVSAPSIHQYSDAGAISSLADHVIVTTSYHTHSLRDLKETKNAVEACHATLSGVVLTRFEGASAPVKDWKARGSAAASFQQPVHHSPNIDKGSGDQVGIQMSLQDTRQTVAGKKPVRSPAQSYQDGSPPAPTPSSSKFST